MILRVSAPLVALLLAVAAARLEAQGVQGRVSAGGAPLAEAAIWIDGTDHRTRSGGDGRFRLDGIPAGRHRLRVAAIGHRPLARDLTLAAGETAVVDLVLTPQPVELAPIVVTGTLRETSVAESPVKVELVSARFLQRNLTNNLMESVQSLPGLSQQVDCGVCFTNSIRINGMEGPYTAVLIDGSPVMSALATTYGLNGINPAIVQQVEIVKGPASTLYGSEAMGGVVNVITKDPRFAPALSVTGFGTTHGETSLDLAAAPAVGGARLLLSGSFARNDRFVDANGDTFSDLPLVSRGAVFGKLALGPANRRTLDLSVQGYYEDRFGGVRGWTRAHRGGGEIYGESIYTSRAAVIGGWTPGLAGRSLRLDFAYNYHHQDSRYGTVPFVARQHTGFAQLAWHGELGRHALVSGVSLRYQHYDDDTPATAAPDRRTTVGVFAQDEIRVHPVVTLLGGLRVERQPAHGAIASPRLALKWMPDDATTLRLNAATGFRVVSLFTEDHAALSGSRTVEVAERLRPERSVTVAASLERSLLAGDAALTLELDAFFTRFSNKIRPDYDTDPERIIYRNLRGHAVTRGAAAAIGLAPEQLPVSFRLSGTIQDVYVVEGGTAQPLAFAPDFKGELTASWESRGGRVTLDYSARLVGPMALPAVPGRPSRSPWYAEQHVQATVAAAPDLFVIAGVKNLFDQRQPDPLVRPDDPFGPEFDTNHVYGPTQGRRLVLGLQYNVAR